MTEAQSFGPCAVLVALLTWLGGRRGTPPHLGTFGPQTGKAALDALALKY